MTSLPEWTQGFGEKGVPDKDETRNARRAVLTNPKRMVVSGKSRETVERMASNLNDARGLVMKRGFGGALVAQIASDEFAAIAEMRTNDARMQRQAYRNGAAAAGAFEYVEGDGKSGADEVEYCGICLDSVIEVATPTVATPCGHRVACEECAQIWYAKEKTCPLCRAEIDGFCAPSESDITVYGLQGCEMPRSARIRYATKKACQKMKKVFVDEVAWHTTKLETLKEHAETLDLSNPSLFWSVAAYAHEHNLEVEEAWNEKIIEQQCKESTDTKRSSKRRRV